MIRLAILVSYLFAAASACLCAGTFAPADENPGTAERLAAGLGDTNLDTRRAAARAVFESGETVRVALLPRLRESLRTEKDGQVRLWLFDALTAMGPAAAPAAAELALSMKTSFGGSRTEKAHQDYRAALALAAIGKPAVEPLRELVADDATKENVRAEAIMALGRIGADAQAAIPAVVPYLGHESARLRGDAVQALGSIGPAAVPALLEAAGHQKPGTRADAVAALALTESHAKSVVDAMLQAGRDAEAAVRIAAIDAIASCELPVETALTGLRQALADDDAAVKRAAVRLISKRRDWARALAPELKRALNSGQRALAVDAAFAIATNESEPVKTLIDELKLPDSPVDAIADVLAMQGRGAGPRLRAGLDSDNPRVRRGCALALGTFRPVEPETPGRLAASLKDADPAVRAACLMAIGQLGPIARPIVDSVRELLADGNEATRAQAVSVLFACAKHDDRLVETLAARLGDTAPVQVAALESLLALGPMGRTAIPQVTEMLAAKDSDVRRRAAAMIASHGAGASEAVTALTQSLNEPDREMRVLAVKTLARIGRPAQGAFAKMESMTMAVDADEREAAFQALGSLGLDAAALRPPLARGLRDSEEKVRRAAIGSIQQLGPAGVVLLPDLIRVAANPKEQRTVERAVRRYERRGPDPSSVPELLELLKNESEPVQLLAIRFLALVRPSRMEIENAFESLREHGSEQVRKKAADAIQEWRTRPDAEAPVSKTPNPA